MKKRALPPNVFWSSQTQGGSNGYSILQKDMWSLRTTAEALKLVNGKVSSQSKSVAWKLISPSMQIISPRR